MKRWTTSLGLVLLMLLLVAGTALAAGNSSSDKSAKPTGPAVATQLTETLTLVPKQANTAQAEATLKDASGRPLTGKEVDFTRKTTFGVLDLGTAKTSFDGTAEMPLPAYAGQTIQVTAKFAGDTGLAAATSDVATLTLQPDPIPRTLGIYSELPNPWYVAALVVVVGGVWVIFALVAALIAKLKRAA
ncbi:MAG: hypothetical protein ACM3XM_08105 [Mycobacterium leprae]